MLIKQQQFIEVDLMGLFGNCLDTDFNILCFSTLARPGCNVHNFANRMECYRCNGPREAGSSVYTQLRFQILCHFYMCIQLSLHAMISLEKHIKIL